MANFKVEPNKGDGGKTNVKVTAETTNDATTNRVLGSVVFTTEDGTEKSVRVYQYGKTVFEADRPNPMASTDTQVSFVVHSWYHGQYSPVNVYTPVGTATTSTPSGGDVTVTISGIPQNPGGSTKTYNVVLTQDTTGKTITLPIKHTAEEQPVPIVHTFTVSPTSLSLEEGSLGHISCMYDNVALLPELVVFTSADTQTATVDANGTVSAIQSGTTQITVVYNNTDPDDGNVYTAIIPIAVREAQIEPTLCTIVFNVNPAGATIKVNNVAISGYTYTATKGVPFAYEVSKQGFITKTDTFTPSGNATINVTLIQKIITGITKTAGGVDLSYNVPISAAGSSTTVYPNPFNIPFSVLYNNDSEETGFFVTGSVINGQWSIQTNLPYGLNYSFGFTYVDEPSYSTQINRDNGSFASIPANTSFTQRNIGIVNLYLTTTEYEQSISSANITQLESTQKIIDSITVGTTGKTDLSYPEVSGVGETVLPNGYHIPLVVTYTNGVVDSTSYYLDKNGHNLPTDVTAEFRFINDIIPNTGSVTVDENPRTTVRSVGPVTILVKYGGNELIAASCFIDQLASSFSITGNSTLTVGNTTQLIAKFNGQVVTTTAEWISSNTSAATVNNGLVTGIATGTPVISATYKESIASKTITVQQALTLIIREEDNRSIYKVGEDTWFNLIVETSNGQTVENATLTHDGQSGDVVFDDYHVKFTNTGQYTITAEYNGMTDSITFSAIALTSLVLSVRQNELTYGGTTVFKAKGIYSDGSEYDIDSAASLILVDGGDYCRISSGTLFNTNTDQIISITDKDVWATANELGTDKIIRNRFIGVPYDYMTLGYAFTKHYAGHSHYAQIKASYIGIESNTVSVLLYASTQEDESYSGVVKTGGDVTAIIQDDNVVSVFLSSTKNTYTLNVLEEDSEPISGTSDITLYYEETVLGKITIENNPTAVYICVDNAGTRATDFTFNPNITETIISRAIWNFSSLKRRITASDARHGFVRFDGTREFIYTNNLESATMVVEPQMPLAILLYIPTDKAISRCTDTYELRRTIVDINGTVIGYSVEHAITITELPLAINDISIESYWYPEVLLSDATKAPYYTFNVTYGQNNVKTFTQDTFDTDFFSHTPANSTLIGFWLDFSIRQQFVQGVSVDADTGVATLPGTEKDNLAEIRMIVQDNDAYDIDSDSKTAILGETIKLVFKDVNGNEINSAIVGNVPEYYLAKNNNITLGVVKFKVYHNDADVTTSCTYQVTDVNMSSTTPPTVSIGNDGYLWFTLPNQDTTGNCLVTANLRVDGLWGGEQTIKLYSAKDFYIGDDTGTKYDDYRKIEPYGVVSTVDVALWADFSGSLVKLIADSWSSSNTNIATVAYKPYAYIQSTDAVVTGQGVAGNGTITANYKNLSVTAGVHCE